MKAKVAGLSVLVLTLAAALWAGFSFAYQRGYTRGANDEYACWNQEPVSARAGWDGKVVGRRDGLSLPGGKKPISKATRTRVRIQPANNIPSKFFP